MSARETLFQGRIFRVVRRSYQSGGRDHIRETIEHPGAVAIVPMLPDDRICLIRNFRIAVDSWLIELPAGTREAGEDPLQTVHRELIEETGYRAGSIEPLGELRMSPGILDERMLLYVARDLTAGPARLEAGEQIEQLVLSREEALHKIDQGEIVDAKTVAGLLLLERSLAATSRSRK